MIDFHVHCFPDALAAKALEVLSKTSGIAPCTDGTVRALKESMERAEITRAVLQPIATKPAQTQTVNTWAAGVQDDRILAFGTLHPQLASWKEEAQRIKSLGLKGVKFHPDYQGFFVDDEAMMAIYEQLAQLDLIILFHAGIDIALPPPCHCPPDRLARVVKRLAGARLVAAHMGGFRCWNQVEEHLVGLDLFFDTSYGLGHLDTDQFVRILQRHGVKRCLFATDSPWADQEEEIAKIERLMLAPGDRQALMEGNARRLLQL
ncbi:MAG: amidohydrolase family protein [Acidobacteriota bacterium]